MTTAQLQHMPLRSAYLCAEPDCNAIGNSSMACPACASGVLMALSVVLDRPESTAQATAEALIRMASVFMKEGEK